MAFITRFIAGIAGLLLVAFLTVLLIVPQSVGQLMDTLSEVPFVARIGVVLLLYVGLLVILFLRARAPKTTRTDALAVRAPGAEAVVTVDSVHDLVLKTVRAIPDVASVKAEVQSVNGKADINLNVVTDNDAVNVPAKQREINRALDQVIKKQLGLQMAGLPKVNIKFGSKEDLPVVNFSPAPVVPSTPVIPAVPVVPEKREEPEAFKLKEEPNNLFFDSSEPKSADEDADDVIQL